MKLHERNEEKKKEMERKEDRVKARSEGIEFVEQKLKDLCEDIQFNLLKIRVYKESRSLCHLEDVVERNIVQPPEDDLWMKCMYYIQQLEKANNTLNTMAEHYENRLDCCGTCWDCAP